MFSELINQRLNIAGGVNRQLSSNVVNTVALRELCTRREAAGSHFNRRLKRKAALRLCTVLSCYISFLNVTQAMGAGKGSGGENYVNPVFKYLLFFSHIIFWLFGAVLIGVGAWGFNEKQRFGEGVTYNKDFDFYKIVFDLTIVMIILGIVIFCLSFAGCLGALRENVPLLKVFSYSLSALFLLELICAVLAFIFSSEVKAKLTNVLKDEAITRYRDDIDLQNMMDWVQKTVSCCGVSSNGYKDWTNNAYFACDLKNPDSNPSVERCAVPYSCCRNPANFESGLINTMCGAEQQLSDYHTANQIIYADGCVDVVLEVVKSKLYIFGGIFLGVAIPQLMGIFLARILCNQIEDTKESTLA